MPKYPFKVGLLIPVLQLWVNVSKFCLRKSSWPFSAAPVTFIRASSTLVMAPCSVCSPLSSSEPSRLMESESLESEKAKRHKRRLQINPDSKTSIKLVQLLQKAGKLVPASVCSSPVSAGSSLHCSDNGFQFHLNLLCTHNEDIFNYTQKCRTLKYNTAVCFILRLLKWMFLFKPALLLRCLLRWNPHGELLKSIQGSRFLLGNKMIKPEATENRPLRNDKMVPCLSH